MLVVNKGLYNYLHNICEQPRWACYKKEKEIVVYLCGGNYFTFDGNDITSISLTHTSLTEKEIDIDLVKKIYKKLFAPKDLRSDDEKLKDKYKITRKRINSKDREEIAKYEEAIKRNRT